MTSQSNNTTDKRDVTEIHGIEESCTRDATILYAANICVVTRAPTPRRVTSYPRVVLDTPPRAHVTLMDK